ncbi:SMI1/KNR4 family protein [Rhizohabitans arisaemae]|uniref:SMI1/KNR4 family protein n=1 Tax=Rhizohabitans arisaemae TaxID=2720610 RepID=UPI0024B114E5|nr:SMI1/KNR4 family protein [Rhizohabitans arisaemae]
MSASDASRSSWSDLLGQVNQPIPSGASEAEIAQVEERLGVRFPPSYRAFLSSANGWGGETLLPVGEIGWLRDLDPHAAEPWDDLAHVPDEEYFTYGDGQDPALHFRSEYLPDTLLIGHFDDGQYLLNPRVTTPEGEWEAWHLASWWPGAIRFRSFWDLMNDQVESRLADYYSEADNAASTPGR